MDNKFIPTKRITGATWIATKINHQGHIDDLILPKDNKYQGLAVYQGYDATTGLIFDKRDPRTGGVNSVATVASLTAIRHHHSHLPPHTKSGHLKR